MSLKSYNDVIGHILKHKREPHLLMGNGFSMAYDPEIFSYNALYRFIEQIDDELLSKLFGIVKSKNFEVVMLQLDNFCELIKTFGSDKELLDKVGLASDHLKKSLLSAVKSLHPEHVFKVPEEESRKCAEFLARYINNGGNIFTTNYDILLYWVLMRSDIKHKTDGFGREREDDEDDFETEPEFSELRWGKHRSTQNVHYLHGALPLFDTGIDIVKEEYEFGKCLLERIEERMENGDYPIFVASGNGEEKLRHIMHNRYLTHCYESLCNIEGSLVTFGFNFGEYDNHIIYAINKAAKNGRKVANRLWSVYVGVYSDADVKHIESIEDKFKCKVNMFDAKTANVWR